MYTYPGAQPKQKFSWRLLAGVVVAGAVLCWWAYRAGRASLPSGPAASSPGPALDLTSLAAPDANAETYRTAGYDELLALLRGKLPGSGVGVQAALAEIARDRPDLAIALAQELGRTDAEKSAWVAGLVKTWTLHDPKNAWAWLANPGNKLTTPPLLGVVMDAMAVSNPQMLLATVDALLLKDDHSGSPFSAMNSVNMGLQAMVKSGHIDLARAAVEAWANDPNKLPIGPAAYQIVAMGMDKTTPEVTAAWLRSLPPSEDRNTALTALGTIWANSDPAAAMRWAESLPAEESQSATVSQIFVGWMQSDPSAAMNWLDDYIPRTAGTVEDDTLIGSMILFSPTTKNDPGEAMKLADAIANPQTRMVYQQQLVQSWGRTDPGAAVEYVMNSQTIDKDQKQLLIQEIQDANKAVNSPNPPEQ
ncbi:MAG TPA: hypothetical protein VNV15_07085 [Opitutaceae bacterium]|jgi:hypothetical protein|nr:hypothetical protein [Opitutaceae bacterium]